MAIITAGVLGGSAIFQKHNTDILDYIRHNSGTVTACDSCRVRDRQMLGISWCTLCRVGHSINGIHQGDITQHMTYADRRSARQPIGLTGAPCGL